jgi:hypothetical protein
MLSCTVRAIVNVSDVVARAVAMFFLTVAGAFSVLTPEPLWVRAMSFVVIGLVPAMAAHLIAFLISWTKTRGPDLRSLRGSDLASPLGHN